MLYTKKGDNGTTKIFGCDQRISKSSAIAEALGSLDEANSFLGVCKAQDETNFDLLNQIQEDLFIIQAQVAGADKKIEMKKVERLGNIVDEIEKQLPPIKTFLISGANLLSANFDFARTVARRAERRVVAVAEENLVKIEPETLAYLNRLSSVLYALARHSAHKSGVRETAPKYK
ncbi:MAG: cob(I)yrinic acid a,c-diamide adenosyltransferase [Candidatus Paceibacterota bacterium]